MTGMWNVYDGQAICSHRIGKQHLQHQQDWKYVLLFRSAYLIEVPTFPTLVLERIVATMWMSHVCIPLVGIKSGENNMKTKIFNRDFLMVVIGQIHRVV
jgi:hypothetical protein